MGAEVRVTGTLAAPLVELDNGSPEGVPVSSLSISDRSRNTIWEINGHYSRDCPRFSRIRLGETPPGFEVQGAYRPLAEGQAYVVSFSGCGTIGGAWFKSVNGRIVSRNGFGDAPQAEIETMH